MIERQVVGRKARSLHGYFVLFSAIFACIVIAGFSRTFFIPVVQGTYSKPLIVHVHGALFFGWTALLVSQALLAATGRLRTHRKVGSVAAWLVVPMLVLGTILSVRDSLHDFKAGDGDAALTFLYGQLADLSMFGLLAGGAMLLRHKPDYHKRWVLLGSLGLLGAAYGRIPGLAVSFTYVFIGLIGSLVVYDFVSRGVPHRATLIGSSVLLVLYFTESPVGESRSWLAAAHRMFGL